MSRNLNMFHGQGNITKFMDKIPIDAQIILLEMELDASDDFELFINNVSCGNFTPSPGIMNADKWNITNCSDSLIKGETIKNNFSINFGVADVSSSYIGGGYIKAVYKRIKLC